MHPCIQNKSTGHRIRVAKGVIMNDTKIKRSRKDRSQGLTPDEFRALSIEVQLEHVTKWEGRTAQFDDSHEYQFSYAEMVRLLEERGIFKVNNKWRYIHELDPHFINDKPTISVSATKKYEEVARTFRASKEVIELFDTIFAGCSMKNKIFSALLQYILEEYQNGNFKISIDF